MTSDSAHIWWWLLGHAPPGAFALALAAATALVLLLRRQANANAKHWLAALIYVSSVGGVTSVMLANAGLDRALDNTYYVVANLHYALVYCAVFGFLAAWYHWFPKLTGYAYPKTITMLHFWLTFAGANLMILPQHLVGLVAFPRHYADYPDAFVIWNNVSALGSWLMMAGGAVFIASTLYLVASKPN